MSEFTVCQTNVRDLDVLLDTLHEMGYDKTKVEVHDEAKNLQGYQGDTRQQKAHVIIRKQYVGGASNDIGFEKQQDGTYKAWVSRYDENRGVGKRIAHGDMKQLYSKNAILKTAKAKGWKVTQKKKDGKVHISVSP